jgi:hypothetical protein
MHTAILDIVAAHATVLPLASLATYLIACAGLVQDHSDASRNAATAARADSAERSIRTAGHSSLTGHASQEG